MASLRERFVALLSTKPQSVVDLPAVVPDEIGREVLRWGMPEARWHKLFHVRRKAIVAWHVATSPVTKPRAPLTEDQIASFTSWLAGISEAELATATAERPLVFVSRVVVPPFAGFAIVHPSLAEYEADEDDPVVRSSTYVVFPCAASEIPEPVDLDWMKLQYAQIGWSDLAREPASAVRSGKPTPAPKKGKAPAKHKRKPMRPRDLRALTSGCDLRKGAVEIENWRGHVLTLAGGEAVTASARVRITGKQHLEALVGAFVRRDEAPSTGEVDPFTVDQVWDLLEATCGDVEDGVEPVFFEERATGRQVARLWVEKKKRTLHIAYAIEDPRVTREVLDAAIADAYLRVFTDHFYRGKVDTLRVHPKDRPEDAHEVPYPA